MRNVHFIGIGGAGMSGIAHMYLKSGYEVSGSDIRTNDYTDRLSELGAKIFVGHQPENVIDADAIVVSSAIREDNVEYNRAKQLGIPIYQRAYMLGQLMKDRYSIAVAGTHGKTTTSSFISTLFTGAGTDPAFVVGGEVTDIGGNARYGKGRFFIAEADESDGSLLNLEPDIAIITNIEPDHLDFYSGLEEIQEVFSEFLKKVRPGGMALVCGEDENIRKIMDYSGVRFVTYGFDDETFDYYGKNLKMNGEGSQYDLYHKNTLLGTVNLGVLGRHMALNSIAAAASALECGISFQAVKENIPNFTGVQRRFQKISEIEGIDLVTDYGHHPTEIRETLKAARLLGKDRIIVVFQPHRYTRTFHLKEEFAKVLGMADYAIVTDVYAAGEKPMDNASGKDIVQIMQENGDKNYRYISDMNEIPGFLRKMISRGDMIMVFGAGNVVNILPDITEMVRRKVYSFTVPYANYSVHC